jgi:hypothetical protein
MPIDLIEPTSEIDLILAEVESSAAEFFKYGEHEGECTNTYRKSLYPSVPLCKKHIETASKRKQRFDNGLAQFKLLRSMSSLVTDNKALEASITELEAATESLLSYGEHEGDCTNKAQKALFPDIPKCTKCLDIAKKRRGRLEVALEQVKVLRSIALE